MSLRAMTREAVEGAVVSLVTFVLVILVGPFRDPTSVVQATTSGLIATLSLILTSITFLLPKQTIGTGQVDQLETKADEIHNGIASLLLSYRGSNKEQEWRERYKPPRINADEDLHLLYGYLVGVKEALSEIVKDEKLDSNTRARAIVLDNMASDLENRVGEYSRFRYILTDHAEVVVLSAPVAIILGLLLLAFRDEVSLIILFVRMAYWFFLLFTIIETALLVRKALGFRLGVRKKSE